MSVHPLVLESLFNLFFLQDEGVQWESHPECDVCGEDNASCGGDNKVVLLRKILERIQTMKFGKGKSEAYRFGDNATTIERKILQQICRA